MLEVDVSENSENKIHPNHPKTIQIPLVNHLNPLQCRKCAGCCTAAVRVGLPQLNVVTLALVRTLSAAPESEDKGVLRSAVVFAYDIPNDIE